MKPKPTLRRQLLGKTGENIATSYLIHHGYKVLERNFHARYGEIDIIAITASTLVFVEVKTRTDTSYGTPEEAVTPKKLREVVKTAQFYMQTHQSLPDAMRVDVIAILLVRDGAPLVKHIENVTG